MGTSVTFVGHATVLIETLGVRILTDPVLRDRLLHLQRHTVEVDPAWYQQLDAVLISHMHWDHFDLSSLEMLDRSTHVIAPRGSGATLRRHGFERVSELRVGDTSYVQSAMIEATYAAHAGGVPFVRPHDNALGFLIHGEHQIYFAGDTDLFSDMETLSKALDVALLPVWGWGPSAGPGHLDPYRAAVSLHLLQPRLAIPIHWGTFLPIGLRRLLPRLLTDPPYAFARFASELAPDVHVCVLRPGTRLGVDELLHKTERDMH